MTLLFWTWGLEVYKLDFDVEGCPVSTKTHEVTYR